MNLQRYWERTGCVELQPYDNQVGEMETGEHGLTYEEVLRDKQVLSCEEL